MAKEKTKKKPKTKKKVKPAVCVGMSNFDLEKRIVALEQRIDKIVNAISKAKSVKGL